jgi:hypothetical protein
MNGNGRGAYNKHGRNSRGDRPNKGRGQGESGERFLPRDSGAAARGNKNRSGGGKQKNQADFNELNRPVSNQKRGQHGGRDRPKWTPPELSKEPIPTPLCPLCNKPIEELAQAVTDKISGEAAHFDCVRKKIAAFEVLVPGDDIAYIGGGRFGIVNLDGQDKRYFKIKKIIEYEGRELRAGWRDNIAGHFSLT